MIISTGQESPSFTDSTSYVSTEQMLEPLTTDSVLGESSNNLLENVQSVPDSISGFVPSSLVVPGTLAHPRRNLEASSVLYETGKDASAVYVVNQGLLKAIVSTSMGRDRIADLYGPGDLIGSAAIEGGQHVETVIALQDSILTPIDPKLGLVHGKSSRFIANALARQMRRHREAIDDAELPVGARLTRILLRMCERFGEAHSATSVYLPIALTHEDLAAFTGSSRVTITRILGDLRQAGALTGSRGVYTANPILLEKATDKFVLKVL